MSKRAEKAMRENRNFGTPVVDYLKICCKDKEKDYPSLSPLKKIDKGDLVIFNEKVSSKSGFTRGLFISYAGFTDEALATFSHGRTVNTILMTVQDLSIALERKLDLTSVLWKKVRALAEEGNFNKSIFDM